jgi:hypothetical protein
VVGVDEPYYGPHEQRPSQSGRDVEEAAEDVVYALYRFNTGVLWMQIYEMNWILPLRR